MNRSEAIARVGGARGPFDVLVVGGGIVGAGVARDAAMRGLGVVLVEQRDFASGTSGRTSRMLHGGLRYLAQGRLGLVRQAQREKKTLARIAPHLVEPMPFLFPAPRSGPWRLWKLRLGVWLYDRLCGVGGNFQRSSRLSMGELAARLPILDAAGFTGAVRYFDAMTNDARLVIDTLRSAARHGAALLNYTRAVSIARDGAAWSAQLRDEETGRSLGVTARVVVNACGPWADRWPTAACRLRLTKGVHLVLDRARLPVDEAVVLTDDSRIVFLLPWGRHTIVGTTDTPYTGDPANPTCEREDVEYLLGIVNRAMPGVALTAGDVRSSYAGVRPLVESGGDGPSDISRRHRIESPQPGWFDVTGGKLTTYRAMGEEVVDRIGAFLGRTLPPCRTAVEPLLPEAPRYSGILSPEPSKECVRHFCEHEWAMRPEDILLRRTSWAHDRATDASLPAQVAGWMAWD